MFGKKGYGQASFSTSCLHACHSFKEDYNTSFWRKCNKECSDRLRFFCTKCHYLKDPEALESVSYFELFEIPEHYDIDKSELDKSFYRLQHLFHPDKFTANEDKNLVDNSTTYSSFINNGYRLLKDDLERAKYLLNMHGYEVLSEEEQIHDLNFLQEIMETREQIEFADSSQELEVYKNYTQKERSSLVSSISRLFEEERFDDIKPYLVKLKYQNRMLEAIDEKEREFF